ncbi:peptidoglycan DD-metalloendopeptidase family protein [Rhodococcus hoagii]|uniref:peptidoglycan DD-metalloendopeptidase family protein n=1 Tax=Rhodococcus hoagii TaxID=43767 RepID=UPI001966C819|nr:peptidoglycan DD-metalloendopeptidase family protein [Prescottella equi]MBM9838627.1 peptidoglycan DD-metalloendopeptidase family protein [Prescottella equi]
MKKGAALAVTLVTFLVMVTIFISTSDEEGAITPCVPGGPSSGLAQGVPAGSLAKPMKSSDAAITSAWRSPDRPGHRGVDIAGPVGTPIFAMADGVVNTAGPADGFGQWIVIDHQISGQLVSTVYGHMFEDGVLVKTGDQVKAGQHIANEGYNGEVSPPGAGGAHLHFEVWEGGRLSGGDDSDPMPYYSRGVDPGTAEASGPSTTTPAPGAPAPGAEMAALPASVGSETHWQVDSVRVARAVHAKFPQLTTIGGWRPSDPYPDHPSGRAVDIMIPDYSSDEGRQLGDSVRDYLWTNRDYFQIEYMIWRQEYIPAQGSPNQMEDRGDPTQNHYDHVHVTTNGGGTPTAGQTYGPAPEVDGSTAPPAASGCVTGQLGESGGELAPGTVPPEFEKWLVISAQQCTEVTPALLASQLQQESGFQPGQVSPTGAVGYTQFMPATWAAYGYPVDEQGNRIGPAGAGDPNSIGDAVMAQGAYDCYVADYLRPKIASGQITGDPIELMLAGYNAGPGAVEQFGGIPPYPETQAYVPDILDRMPQFDAQFAGKAAER